MLNNIKQIRKSLGITVAELAQKLNMSQGNLTKIEDARKAMAGKIENGQVDMKAETAAAIAAILQCPLDKLIAEEKDNVSPLSLPLNLPADSCTMAVRDNNMSPTLISGDIAVVRPCQTKGADGIYLLQRQGREVLRRLQTLSDGRVAVLCDNQAYLPEYAVTAAELEISGHVVSKIAVVSLS